MAREGRPIERKTKKKEKRVRMGRCPWGRGHWSRQSLGRGMMGRWGRGGCWRSSDLCLGWWTEETGTAVVAAWLVCECPPEVCLCSWASCV